MIRILKHNPDLSRQLSNTLLRSVISINCDPPQGWLQQPIQLLRQGRLPGAILAHYCEEVATIDFQINGVERLLARRICEGDLLDNDHLRRVSESIFTKATT